MEVGAYSQEVGMYSHFGDNPSLGEPTLGNEGYKKKKHWNYLGSKMGRSKIANKNTGGTLASHWTENRNKKSGGLFFVNHLGINRMLRIRISTS